MSYANDTHFEGRRAADWTDMDEEYYDEYYWLYTISEEPEGELEERADAESAACDLVLDDEDYNAPNGFTDKERAAARAAAHDWDNQDWDDDEQNHRAGDAWPQGYEPGGAWPAWAPAYFRQGEFPVQGWRSGFGG